MVRSGRSGWGPTLRSQQSLARQRRDLPRHASSRDQASVAAEGAWAMWPRVVMGVCFLPSGSNSLPSPRADTTGKAYRLR